MTTVIPRSLAEEALRIFGVSLRLEIPGPLPGLNDVINAKSIRYGGGGHSAYSKLKSKWGSTISLLARHAKLKPVESGYFTYLFREPNKRRDPSNFVAGGVKIVEDGLQEAGILANDGWKQVVGFAAHWIVDADRPGVTLFIHPERLLTKDEALSLGT